MASFDIFNNDAFALTSLVAAINEVQEDEQLPLPIVDSLFSEEGVRSPVVGIEMQGDTLGLVSTSPRGSRGQLVRGSKRKMTYADCVHLAESATIHADEVYNVRAFGSETELEAVQTMVSERQTKMRRQLEVTQTYHRIGAVKGLVLDADGKTPILDLFDMFGVAKHEFDMGLASGSTKINHKLMDAKRLSEKALGMGIMVNGWVCLAGRNFFDKLTRHENVEAAYDRWMDGAFMRADTRVDFSYAGVDFIDFTASVDGIDFIDPDEALLMPRAMGEGTFRSYYAPAEYMDTVGTQGLPYYSSLGVIERAGAAIGVEIEAQSNPLHINLKPRAVIHLS